MFLKMRKELCCFRYVRYILWSNIWDIGRNDWLVKEWMMWKLLFGWILKGVIIIEEFGVGERVFGVVFVVMVEEKIGVLGVKVRGGVDIVLFVIVVVWGGEKILVSFYYFCG